MKILTSICPEEKLDATLTELYEGGADVKFVLPTHFNRTGDIKVYRILYAMGED